MLSSVFAESLFEYLFDKLWGLPRKILGELIPLIFLNDKVDQFHLSIFFLMKKLKAANFS